MKPWPKELSWKKPQRWQARRQAAHGRRCLRLEIGSVRLELVSVQDGSPGGRDAQARPENPAIISAIFCRRRRSRRSRALCANCTEAIVETPDKGRARKTNGEARGRVNDRKKWLKPYPNAAWRENVEVLLVALAVAMGIRTFFLQPFKIPTGSMQPTLFGVTSMPDATHGSDEFYQQANFQVPSGLARIREWFAGVSYVACEGQGRWRLAPLQPPFKILIFNIYQKDRYRWTKLIGFFFRRTMAGYTLQQRAGLMPGRTYHQGEQVVRCASSAATICSWIASLIIFARPNRGEIIVFETKG